MFRGGNAFLYATFFEYRLGIQEAQQYPPIRCMLSESCFPYSKVRRSHLQLREEASGKLRPLRNPIIRILSLFGGDNVNAGSPIAYGDS